MKILRTAISEIIGLFVDDWRFAVIVVIWIALIKSLAPHPAPVLFSLVFALGLGAFTLFFVMLKARPK